MADTQSTAAGQRSRKRLYPIGDICFNVILYSALTFFTFLCLFPFLNTLANAFSSNQAIQTGQVVLWPIGWQLDAMKSIMTDVTIIRSLFITIYITVLGTALNLLFTVVTAYPLSRRDLKGRAVFMNFMIITMLFSGGMIPTFLLVKNMGMLNSLWALMIPGLISAFNVIIMKSFFQSLPDELREAAIMDGCGNIRYLIRIVLPLSGASLATIGLFYAVGNWNAYFNAVLYIDNPDLHTLQVKLRNILLLSQMDTSLETMQLQQSKLSIIQESLKASVIIFATVPILIVYPFLQKYFVKGSLLGSVKG
ncbi:MULTISPECIES: carbohydrate ABC transporter permease [Paenibacillus]|jgi:putative aldouronate transport system permease protein|uniref:Carbohydrate ABC transporter permease n=1 Tax=Paenibacillus baimaensis TaxID=2982185 RepID=A0ABT2UCX2_9BACL|nr:MULTISPECIES: carbohydrate ABC transporter permease [unclassified Paenibacillus]MCU6792481.1 carbohydrate ABC transporter permease [Paenibacillus sp. WQ 127069]OMF07452.1 ABC transporter permease [Paenibacillus sp. FSL H7-0331]